MPDELDPRLLRSFAQAEQEFAADSFVSSVVTRMQPGRALHFGAGGLSDALVSVLGGLGRGIVLPLRLRHTRLLTLGAAAMTLWAAFF
jgi:hypothetical protein